MPITLEKYQKNLDYWNNFNKRNFITELRSCIEYIKLFNIDYAVCGFNSPIQLKEIYNNFMKKPKKINFDPIKLRLPKKFYDPRYWN
ncbi:hypothetical protein ACIJYB_00745 [Candidatus Pelagibacter bacterium nBUS_44]|uniref:hypothetical protein n=1 Tax=Candidatus Pelagibacter bacterium nBUS_44 TaxID=3374195 RepID=UPI003EBA17A8